MRYYLTLLLLGAAVLSPASAADPAPKQPTPEEIMAMMPKPQAEHEKLALDAGVWDAKVTMTDPMTGQQESNTAVEVVGMLGGMWQTTEFKGEMMGMPFTGRSQTGYDPQKKKYVGSWIDSWTPGMMVLEGAVNAKGAVEMVGTGYCCMERCDAQFKMVSELAEGGKTRTFDMYRKSPMTKNEWAPVMHIDYTKRAE